MKSSKFNNSVILATLAVLLLCTLPSYIFAQGVDNLYWIQRSSMGIGSDAIGKINLNENTATTILDDAVISDGEHGFDIDFTNQEIYWTDDSANSIQKSDLNGGNVETVLTGLNRPAGIELDLGSEKIYYVEITGDKIGRVNFDGSDKETVINRNEPRDICLDISRGFIYYTLFNSSQIGRANLDGTDDQIIIDGTVTSPYGIECDTTNNILYVASGANKIFKYDIDSDSLSDFTAINTTSVRGLELDTLTNKLYWIQENSGEIYSANTDGSDNVLVSNAPTRSGTDLVLDIDTDKDGTQNSEDMCLTDSNKSDPGQCGCGNLETDTDSDGTADCIDICANDPAKTEQGVCGCSIPDSDIDSDGALDCNETCDEDKEKTEPGTCGCGVADLDEDTNGIIDCLVDNSIFQKTKKLMRLFKKFSNGNGKSERSLNKKLKNLVKLISEIPEDNITIDKSSLVKLTKKLNRKLTQYKRLLKKGATRRKLKKAQRKSNSILKNIKNSVSPN